MNGVQNMTEKEWEKQVHTALQMHRAFSKDERRYPLSKWYEVGFDVETIKLAYSYVCRETSSLDGNPLDSRSVWRFFDKVLGWINMHGIAAFQQQIDEKTFVESRLAD